MASTMQDLELSNFMVTCYLLCGSQCHKTWTSAQLIPDAKRLIRRCSLKKDVDKWISSHLISLHRPGPGDFELDGDMSLTVCLSASQTVSTCSIAVISMTPDDDAWCCCNYGPSLETAEGHGKRWPRAKSTCLKPYRGDKNTAVAGGIVILNQHELPTKQTGQGLGQPKGKKGKGASTTQPQTVRKVEAHLAATTSPTEVLYIEAWGEIGDKLMQLCQVGDVVAIQGGTVQSVPAVYSTSKLHYTTFVWRAHLAWTLWRPSWQSIHGQLICMWFLHESYHNTLNLYKPKLQECHVCRSDTVHLKIRFESQRLSGDIQHKDCPLQR